MTDPPLNYYCKSTRGRPDFVQNVNVPTWENERGEEKITKLRTNAEMLMSTIFRAPWDSSAARQTTTYIISCCLWFLTKGVSQFILKRDRETPQKKEEGCLCFKLSNKMCANSSKMPI